MASRVAAGVGVGSGAREGLERVGQEGGTSQSARRTAPKGFGERNLEGQQLGSPLYSELPNAWSSQKRALPQGSPCPVGSPHFVSIGPAEMHSLQDLFELLSLSLSGRCL